MGWDVRYEKKQFSYIKMMKKKTEWIPIEKLVDKATFVEWVKTHSNSNTTYLFDTAKHGRKKRRWLNLKSLSQYIIVMKGMVGKSNPQIIFKNRVDLSITTELLGRSNNEARYRKTYNLFRMIERTNYQVTFNNKPIQIKIKSEIKNMRDSRIYFNPITGMKSSKRSQLLLNGEPVVEIDYRSIHPRLLMSILDIGGYNDCYTLDNEFHILPRNLIKRGLNILLNANSSNGARFAIERCEEYKEWVPKIKLDPVDQSEHKYSIFISAMNKHPLAKAFSFGLGVVLMYLESELCINVLTRFLKAYRAPILSIHDSFIVQKKHREDIVRIMNEELKKFLESSSEIKPFIKKWIEDKKTSRGINRAGRILECIDDKRAEEKRIKEDELKKAA